MLVSLIINKSVRLKQKREALIGPPLHVLFFLDKTPFQTASKSETFYKKSPVFAHFFDRYKLAITIFIVLQEEFSL